MDVDSKKRERDIYRVTIYGSAVNTVLLVFKFIAGILGGSAAMIADAVHSLSDFLTDIMVLIFVRLSSRPIDKDHDFGHGKYETLATAIIGIALFCVGVMICYNGVWKVWQNLNGQTLPRPGTIALMAALLSIVLKEWCYQFTARVGRKYNSQAVIANAWHHRSDAMSSIGTAVGIGGAIVLGDRWTVLDPLAAIVVSVFILRTACKMVHEAVQELLEVSLSDDIENHIVQLAEEEPTVSEVHDLRTRRIGNRIAIDMHLRMPPDTPLYVAHEHATNIEYRLRLTYGKDTLINIHMEPTKA